MWLRGSQSIPHPPTPILQHSHWLFFVLVGSTERKCVLHDRAVEIVAGEVTLLVVKEEWVQTSVSHFAVHVHHVGLSVLSARVLWKKKKKIQDSSSELTRWFPSRCLSASLLWSVLSRHMLCNNPSPYEFNCTYYFQHTGQRFRFFSLLFLWEVPVVLAPLTVWAEESPLVLLQDDGDSTYSMNLHNKVEMRGACPNLTPKLDTVALIDITHDMPGIRFPN